MSVELQDAVALARELPPFKPSYADIELEAAIEIEMVIVMHDERYTHAERVAAFEEVRRLHRQRRPEMVAFLERMRGLR